MIALLFLPFISVAHAITISMSIPGATPNSSSTPGAFVSNFYQFALMIGGILAFGIMVYGGVKYMASAGNPSGQGDAKEWIEAALLGLLLLVGAYFILNVVNPQLLNLGLPKLTPVNISASNTTQATIKNAIAACIAACKDASCTATCNRQGAAAQSAFGGTCSASACPSGQMCQNDGNGGHMCLELVPSLPILSPSPIPPGDYLSCAQANCPASGKKCYPDLSNSKYYNCQ